MLINKDFKGKICRICSERHKYVRHVCMVPFKHGPLELELLMTCVVQHSSSFSKIVNFRRDRSFFRSKSTHYKGRTTDPQFQNYGG